MCTVISTLTCAVRTSEPATAGLGFNVFCAFFPLPTVSLCLFWCTSHLLCAFFLAVLGFAVSTLPVQLIVTVQKLISKMT